MKKVVLPNDLICRGTAKCGKPFLTSVEFVETGVKMGGNVTVTRNGFAVGDTPVPPEFAEKTLQKQTRVRALKLVASANGLLSRDAKQLLFLKAGVDGLKEAFGILRLIQANSPHGKPKLYAELPHQTNAYGQKLDFVTITDGREAHSIAVQRDLNLPDLPVNLYCQSTHVVDTRLSQIQYEIVAEKIREFFEILKKLYFCSQHAECERLSRIFAAFFDKPEKAKIGLERLCREVEHKNEADTLYEGLKATALLEFEEGYLIPYWGFLQYVTRDGKVYRIWHKKSDKLKRIVLAASKTGKLPPNLWKRSIETEEYGPALEHAAQTLKDVNPSLALVILPTGGTRQ